ncbi:MAG: hypothetical protein JHD16_04610, partial [Solirubrobacteraceae bacterium]|nr:hypothetical protein [Solirubrobacteraceae bacterium]
MTPRPLQIARRAVLLAGVAALMPAAAQASTWTVDDDGVQCPSAPFSSIQAAVDYAAPNDTIIVCDGLYQESSIPANGTYSPAAAGSRNGLTIQKPVTIKGTGASKVTIEPDPALGESLAGATPNLRDGGGNVISVVRQSLGSSDDNEQTVNISGVTVRSPYSYAEAGVAYFNTSGAIVNSVVGPLRRANADEAMTRRPYGWGVVMTNFQQGAGPGSGTVRRQVSVERSVVTGYQAGGILFDGARGADGTPESAARAGITMYGYVKDSEITGGGESVEFGQTGVKYFAGVRGGISGSLIEENLATATTPTAFTSYGVFLQDAETGADVDVPGARALTVNGNAFIRNRVGLFNADLAGTAVALAAPVSTTGNWWGCAAGPLPGASSMYTNNNARYGCQGISGDDAGTPAAPSVELGTISTVVPTALPVPGKVTDAAPTVAFAEPTGMPEVKLGDTISPVIVAGDDF